MKPWMSWFLFLMGSAIIAYLSEDSWPMRVILFLVMAGGITTWALWRMRGNA